MKKIDQVSKNHNARVFDLIWNFNWKINVFWQEWVRRVPAEGQQTSSLTLSVTNFPPNTFQDPSVSLEAENLYIYICIANHKVGIINAVYIWTQPCLPGIFARLWGNLPDFHFPSTLTSSLFWGPHFIFMYLSAFYKFNMITSNVTDGLLATDWFLIANLAFTDTDITTNLSSGSVSVCLYTLHIYI